MPELPEVESVCRSLDSLVSGRRIEDVKVYWPRTVEPLSVSAFEAAVAGQTVERIERRAKLILFHLSSRQILTIHLRMTGSLLWQSMNQPTDDASPHHLRVKFCLETGDELRFFDARKFGRMRLYHLPEWVQKSARYGPEPLDGSINRALFAKMLRSHNRQLKPLLLDQRFIAGIGNIYADEVLFKARIHPLQLSSTISTCKAGELFDAIVETLETAIEYNGTTFRDYRSALGEAGTNQTNLKVYGKPSGSPCPRCGTALDKLQVAQRGTTICPSCQILSSSIKRRTRNQ